MRINKQNYKRQYAALLKLSTYLWLNVFLLVLGLYLSIKQAGWLQAVGTSIVASAIVGFLFAYQLKIDRRFDDARSLYDSWGLLSIENNRSDRDMYGDLMQNCSQQLDIMAVSLSRFSSDFRQELSELERRGVKMRFLLLDPTSAKVDDRALEDESAETPNAASLRSRIQTAVGSFTQLNLKNLTIRYYSCTPSVNYFRIDNKVFIGSYFVGIPSRNSVTFFCRAGDDLAKSYNRHFEAVWSSDQFSRNTDSDSTPKKVSG